MPIPDAVRQSVLQRVRRLERSELAVLMRASVIGCRFSVAILLGTVPSPPGRVYAALAHACALGLLVAEPAGDFYAFPHALTRDVVYGELLNMHVRPIHRRVARAIERLTAAAELPLHELAYHYWIAGDAPRAKKYNELAGDGALVASAEEEARVYYQRARTFLAIGSAEYARLTAKLAEIEQATRTSR